MKNLTWIPGKIVGRLKLIEKVKEGKPNYWMCKCSCGKIKKIHITGLCRKEGTSLSCGCRIRESARKNKGEHGLSILYYSYKVKAIERGFVFELTKQQFKDITSQRCFYCGKEPRQISYDHDARSNEAKIHSEYIYNGIDRRNNDMGYVLHNCLPCCGRCNEAKMDISFDDFLQWVTNVYNYRVSYNTLIENRPHGKF